MFDIQGEFNETTDLYLQILREAQRVEDRKLIRMIAQKLKDNVQMSFPAEAGAEIIPFPVAFAPPIQPIEEPRQLWPKNVLAQLLIMLTGYMLLIVVSNAVLS